jgi:hypothetical protein
MFQSPPTSPMFFTTKEDDFMTWALQRRADPQEAIGPTSLGDRTRSATPLMHTEVRKSASLYMPWTLRTARHHFFWDILTMVQSINGKEWKMENHGRQFDNVSYFWWWKHHIYI